MNRIEVAQKMLEDNKEDLLRLEIRENFLQRKAVTGTDVNSKMELGQIQQNIKDSKEWIKFLEEKIKEKFK